MTSILTNTSAMAALTTLRSIGEQLGATSENMSSGLRVAKASDDVAYWSISTKMRSDTKAMEAATESVGLAKGVVDTAYAGLQNVRDAFVEIRNIAITASSMQPAPTSKAIIPAFYPDPEFVKSDVHEMELSVQELLDQARNSILSSSFAGVNLLYHPKNGEVKASEQEFNFVTGFVDGKVQTLDMKAMDSRLVDADMEETSARLKALETQRQLATNSLQIANSTPSMMLQLFQ